MSVGNLRTPHGMFGHLSEALVGAALLCCAAFAAQWRYGFGWSDEGLLWYASQRTALGEVPLRDFFSYDPGRYYWTATIFRISGHDDLFTLLAANAIFGAIGLAAVWFAMCKAELNRGLRLVCAILIVVALGYPRHKVFEQTASLCLVSLLFLVLTEPRRAARWFVFGAGTGIAAILGRNHGVFYVVAAGLCHIYLAFTDRRKPIGRETAAFIGGVVVGYSPLLIMLAAMPGFRDAFVASILFTANWQLALPIPFIWRVQLGHLAFADAMQSIAVGIACVVIPAFYVVGVITAAVNQRTRHSRDRLMLLLAASCLAGLPYLQQAFDRADFGHIAQAVVPIFPASFVVIGACGRSERRLAAALTGCFCTLCIAAWLPSEPAIAYARQQKNFPGTMVWQDIGGRSFAISKDEAEVLEAVRIKMAACGVAPGEFWTAPHFPGIYAYLHATAPFWELYYLYPRSRAFQLKHIEALSHVRLILLAPQATVDGLERLKLKNTYPLLMQDISDHYTELSVPQLPQGMKIYISKKAPACHDPS